MLVKLWRCWICPFQNFVHTHFICILWVRLSNFGTHLDKNVKGSCKGQTHRSLIKKKLASSATRATEKRRASPSPCSSIFFTACHSIGECPSGGQAVCLCMRWCVKVWMNVSMWTCERARERRGGGVRPLVGVYEWCLQSRPPRFLF